jgi:uncharacterized membrane protein
VLTRFPEVWVLFGPAIYLALAITPPLLALGGHRAASHAVFVCFRFFCHQMPRRSLFLGGQQIAVCARCFALALGVFLGAIVSGRLCDAFPGRRWLKVPFLFVVVAAIPMAIDGFTQLFGLRESTNTLRVLTGLLLGGMTAAWAVPVVYEAFREQLRVGTES